jgi:hypothetical protein
MIAICLLAPIYDLKILKVVDATFGKGTFALETNLILLVINLF